MNVRGALVLAPMAGLSTPALRLLVERWGGCDCYFSEMISAGAMLAGGRHEKYYLETAPSPDKVVHQLVGADEDQLVEAARLLDQREGAGIDLNMGCSAPEIERRGAGVAWMRDLAAAGRLVARARRVVRRKSLSVKLRLGDSDSPEELLAFCRMLELESCDFITIHPRTSREKFKRLARWDCLEAIRRELKIPLVGNGDLRTWADFQARAGLADGLMIGRAAARAPWFFAYLRARQRDPAAVQEVDLAETASLFFELLPAWQPPDFLESRARRFMEYFSQNLVYGHHLFSQVRTAGGFAEMAAVVARYFAEHPENRRFIEKD